MSLIKKSFILGFLFVNIFANFLSGQEASKVNISGNMQEVTGVLETFQEYMRIQGKFYSTIEEFNSRFNAFKKNLENITEKNTAKLSKFMDLTPGEFKQKYLTLKVSDLPKASLVDKAAKKPRNLQGGNAPKSFDWRSKGIVSSVKDQGECGCCWAFSSLANIESQYAKKYSTILDLSEEQLLDCDITNGGCNGGNMEDAFKYIQSAGGVMRETEYRYTQIKDSCKFKKGKVVARLSGYKVFDTADEEEIKELLFTYGPLSAAVNADNMQNYTGGIMNDSEAICPSANINHAILIVGYGEENGQGFWIVKNSWGQSWGEEGYFRIARGKGTCGINQYITTSFIA